MAIKKNGVDNMKKTLNLIIMLLILISLFSVALAEETEENQDEEDPELEDIDNETEEEIEIMNNSLGAEIRLLQLQKAILKNLLKGEMTVEVLQGLDYNTSELETILTALNDLLEEVKAADPQVNNSVQIFVELKTQARNLTTQFRETLKELLDDTKLKEIRETLRNTTNDELQNYSNQIRNRIRQFNRNQLYRLYGIIGDTNNSIIEQYMNGTITLGQVKLQLCKRVNQMIQEQKYTVFSEIKEHNLKKKIKAQETIGNMYQHGKESNNGNGGQQGNGQGNGHGNGN